MLLCAQYILPVSSEPIIDGAVLVRDGVIRDIGKAEQLRLRYPEEEVVDQGLAAVMPGLVDLHTRLEQSVLRGVVNDAPYVQWLAEVAQKSGRMEASDWFDSAILGGLDALSSGITTVADITLTGASCTAVNKLGLRSVIYRQVGAMDKNRIDAAMQFAQKDILHWREEVDSDRVTRPCFPPSRISPSRRICPWTCGLPAAARSPTSCATARRPSKCTAAM